MTDKNPLEKVMDDFSKKIKPKKNEDVTLTTDFSVEKEEEDGEDIILSGRLFKSGSYPDKNFELTPHELYDAIHAFLNPVPMDLEHRPSELAGMNLTGAFGHLEKVWADESGEWMMGQARKPKALHQIMPETKVSATFSRDDKHVVGCAWTATPRVTGAELVAFANSRHSTQQGQYAMQDLHDTAVQHGAVCNRANMASKHEAKGIQAIHDQAVKHGAACQSIQPGQSMPIFSKPTTTRSTRMNMKEFLIGKAKEEGVEIDENDPTFARDDTAVAEMQAKLKAAEDRAAALEAAQTQHAANFARMESESRQSAAATFAKDQVIAGRISPAAQEPLAALTVRILEADSTATFADGEKSNAVLLREVLDALESDFKIFTKNTVGDDAGPFAALFAETKTPGVGEAEARDEILKKMRNATPAGRQIEKEKQNHA